jgi:hypothetical protein
VDLTALTFFGSHGLAALADAASTAQQRRGRVRVVADETRAVIRPLQITGLDEVLAPYYSIEGGVASASNLPLDQALLRRPVPERSENQRRMPLMKAAVAELMLAGCVRTRSRSVGGHAD